MDVAAEHTRAELKSALQRAGLDGFATPSQLLEVIRGYRQDRDVWMDQDQRWDVAFDNAMTSIPEDESADDDYVGSARGIAYLVLELEGQPYRHELPGTKMPNPLVSWYPEDREAYASMIRKVCGCSEKTATQIADAHPQGFGLQSATAASLRALGATPKQAERIVSAFALNRLVQEKVHKRKDWRAVRSPRDVGDYVGDYLSANMGQHEQEHFVAIFLDARQRILDTRVVSIGTLAQVDVHPRELFKDAIRLRAHAIILAHNHPSGDPEPSQADYALTTRMKDVGQMLGIPVLDHIVVGRDFSGRPRISSMAAEGRI